MGKAHLLKAVSAVDTCAFCTGQENLITSQDLKPLLEMQPLWIEPALRHEVAAAKKEPYCWIALDEVLSN